MVPGEIRGLPEVNADNRAIRAEPAGRANGEQSAAAADVQHTRDARPVHLIEEPLALPDLADAARPHHGGGFDTTERGSAPREPHQAMGQKLSADGKRDGREREVANDRRRVEPVVGSGHR